MKTIGILGGMAWESTVTYYQVINRTVNAMLGGHHSARCVLYSVEFEEIIGTHRSGDWDRAARILSDGALRLKAAGADFLILATNTMHIVAPAIVESAGLPFLHIAEMTANRLREAGISRVGLLGTKFTMELDFYKGVLKERGINVVIPSAEEREEIHRVINEELALEKFLPSSREYYANIIADMARAGAEGVILGCTEIGLLIQQAHSALPVFDTAVIHAEEAARFALR